MAISPRRLARDLKTNLKPRELFYWLIGNLVYWSFRATMRVQLYGMADHYGPPAPATLAIATHKRDWDPIMFAAFSYYHRGWLAPDGRRVGFAGRADIWDRGFLATVVGYRSWPRWAQWLLDKTSFVPIANRMRGYPILRIPEYTLRQYFRTLLKEEGNLPLSDVLSLDTLLAFTQREDALHRQQRRQPAQKSRPLRVSDVLGWEYRSLTNRPVHARHLTPARYEQLRAWLRATADQQLETLARSLDSGDTLWFTPEGAVTLDGGVMRIRNGLHALISRARPDVRCLPVNFCYDFMTAKRRMIACIGVGPSLEGLRDLDRAELARRIAPALARQTVVTMSQLGSKRVLVHLTSQQFRFDPEAEAGIMLAEVRRLADLGAWVQRDLLTEEGLRRRLRAFVAYAEVHHLLVRDQAGGHLVSAKMITIPSSRYWENPVRYCANELAALEAVLQPEPAAAEASPDASQALPPESAATRTGQIEAPAEQPDQTRAEASAW